MKKNLKEGHGTCDFCQNKDVDGVAGNIKKNYRGCEYIGTNKVIDDWEFSIWNEKKIIKGDWRFESSYKPVDKVLEIEPLICKNCIKELSKLIK